MTVSSFILGISETFLPSATPQYKFPHALVIGIDKYPGKITRALNKKKLKSRCAVRPFVKVSQFKP